MRVRLRSLLVSTAVFATLVACGGDDDAGLTTDETTSDAEGVATITLTPSGQPSDDDLDRTVDIIEQRLAGLGIDDAQLDTTSGAIVVSFASATADLQSVADLIGDTAELTFRPVVASVPTDLAPGCDSTGVDGIPAELFPQFDGGSAEPTLCFGLGEVAVDGSIIEDSEALVDGLGNWSVTLTILDGPDGIDGFNEIAGECFDATATCPTRQLAIVLDDIVMSAPSINEPTFERDAITITGQFTEDQATNLALALRTGALPVTLEVSAIEPPG